MIDGTVSAQVIRLIRTTALQTGVAPAELNRLPGLDPELLGDDLIRVPVATALRIWELIHARGVQDASLRITAAANMGSLHVWDYLFTTGPTLSDSLKTAFDLHAAVTDPAVGFQMDDDGRLLTVRYTGIEPEPILAATEEFALSLLLRRIREATGRPLVPVRVAFGHRARGRHRHLIDAFDTDRVDFGAPHTEFTLLDASSLPTGTDPHLGRIIRRHAELTIASAKSAPSWLDKLHAAMIEALIRDQLSLDVVAHRLAMSPRTLQRRLGEQGTSWREELEAVRHSHATALLRDTDLSVQSVAARLGYTDARALRRAFHRWTGRSPDAFRRERAAADG
ncbi:helix-turn-helix domain-containing protein [Nocardia sp. NPDC057440]|uniref:AraC family transcriptional regulator n=1 Tax=Nocardia sp. NPDC057440 TaxID=3346134 RepID=UPI00366BB74C